MAEEGGWVLEETAAVRLRFLGAAIATTTLRMKHYRAPASHLLLSLPRLPRLLPLPSLTFPALPLSLRPLSFSLPNFTSHVLPLPPRETKAERDTLGDVVLEPGKVSE